MALTSETLNESSKNGTHLCLASHKKTAKSQWFALFFSENPGFFSMLLSTFKHSVFKPVAFMSVILNVSR